MPKNHKFPFSDLDYPEYIWACEDAIFLQYVLDAIMVAAIIAAHIRATKN